MRIEVEQTIHLLRRYKLADHERSLTTRLAAIEFDDASMTRTITLSGPAIWEGRLRCRISRGMLNRFKAWQVVIGLLNSMGAE